MRNFTLGLVLCLASFFSMATEQEVIYGEDNRVDVYDSNNSLFVELSESTAAMISSQNLTQQAESYTVHASTLQARGMCASERFSEQITAARCSGFLVGEDLLVTAGHCVKSQFDCKNYLWVFDYKMQAPNKASVDVPKTSVYKCKEIIEQSLDRRSQDDYALIRLEKKVNDRRPLNFRREGKVADKTGLVVIGHPTGLPTKIADGAFVRKNTSEAFFVANLDTYGGNSGSAVFDMESGVVEGILVRGEVDYVYDSRKGCRVSNVCADNACRGEDVSRITRIKKLQSL